MEISIESRQTRIDIDQNELTNKTRRILEGLGCSAETALSILFVDTQEMTAFNRRYRGEEGPTNVLSFCQREGELFAPNPHLLGDVVISTDRAASDAEHLGYTYEEMILYLLIHGVLHLLGHEHEAARDAATMHAEVERIFAGFYPDSSPDEG